MDETSRPLALMSEAALEAFQAHQVAQDADAHLRHLILEAAQRPDIDREKLALAARPRWAPREVRNLLDGAGLLRAVDPLIDGKLHIHEYPILRKGYWEITALPKGRAKVQLLDVSPNLPGDQLTPQQRALLAVQLYQDLELVEGLGVFPYRGSKAHTMDTVVRDVRAGREFCISWSSDTRQMSPLPQRGSDRSARAMRSARRILQEAAWEAFLPEKLTPAEEIINAATEPLERALGEWARGRAHQVRARHVLARAVSEKFTVGDRTSGPVVVAALELPVAHALVSASEQA